MTYGLADLDPHAYAQKDLIFSGPIFGLLI